MTTSTTTGRSTLHPAVIVAAATVAAMVIWLIARAADVDFEVETLGGDTMTVNLGIVTAAALGASLSGWALLAWLQRRSDRARHTWTVIATAVLVASLPGPLFSDASGGARISLMLMHLAVGSVLIPGLRATASAAPLSSPSDPAEERTMVGSPH
jgi:predicted permease